MDWSVWWITITKSRSLEALFLCAEVTMENVCNEKHKRVDERLETHEKRLNAHAEQLDGLSLSDARNTTSLDNLCKQIADLVQTVKWLIGLVGSALLGFFFYAVQTGIFEK